MRYYLNASPPPALLERLLVLEKRWQKRSASLPHMTLVSPRTLLPESFEDELIAEILRATIHISQFPIRLTRIGSFANKENIHICVDRTPTLVYCHRQLMRATEHILAPSTGTFAHLEHPHITISDHIPEDQREAAWNELSQEAFKGSFLCEHVHLLRREDNNPVWTLVESFPLQ